MTPCSRKKQGSANPDRVKTYTRTTYYPNTGESRKEVLDFTQAQADEVGAVLEYDGIHVASAVRLCERWSKMGKFIDVHYIYYIVSEGRSESQDN